jgi:type I restriction enzyme R subunit
LDKYADEGISDIQSMDVLRVKPFTEFGSPLEILNTESNTGIGISAIQNRIRRQITIIIL